ncbi:MAG: carbohydrate-binding module family 20 domain-containing protein [Acidobacteriota bacterium]
MWVENAAPSGGSADVHFTCNNGTTFWGQNVYVVGNDPAIGSWDPAQAVQLSPNAYPTWDGIVTGLPASTTVEWKCIKKHNGQVTWQGGANNSVTTPSSGQVSAAGSF